VAWSRSAPSRAAAKERKRRIASMAVQEANHARADGAIARGQPGAERNDPAIGRGREWFPRVPADSFGATPTADACATP
jgi:hypothetical protein